MNSTLPPSLLPFHPVQTAPHNTACACALCGMWAKCRAEVMGSSRKVRSRVQGGVKETRSWLLFAFFPQLRFLPTEGCVQCATVLTPQQPRHCTGRVCFSAFIKSSPGRKTTNITTSLGAGEFSTLYPSSSPWEIFCVCTCEVWCLFISSHVGCLHKAVCCCCLSKFLKPFSGFYIQIILLTF